MYLDSFRYDVRHCATCKKRANYNPENADKCSRAKVELTRDRVMKAVKVKVCVKNKGDFKRNGIETAGMYERPRFRRASTIPYHSLRSHKEARQHHGDCVAQL